MDKNVWKHVRKGVYSIVLALPEIFFQLTSMFWLIIIRDRFNAFFCWLVYITVNKAHLMWGWKEFCKKFSNVGIFRLVFSKVSIMVVLAIMTSNILEYIWKTLYLKKPVRLYWRLLDCPSKYYLYCCFNHKLWLWRPQFLDTTKNKYYWQFWKNHNLCS